MTKKHGFIILITVFGLFISFSMFVFFFNPHAFAVDDELDIDVIQEPIQSDLTLENIELMLREIMQNETITPEIINNETHNEIVENALTRILAALIIGFGSLIGSIVGLSFIIQWKTGA